MLSMYISGYVRVRMVSKKLKQFVTIFEEHMVWLEKVLEKIFIAGLTINLDKCEFCRSQARYLRFIVSKD